jgi:hypothetical protein
MNQDIFAAGTPKAMKRLFELLAETRCPNCDAAMSIIKDPEGVTFADFPCDCPEEQP